MKAIVYTKYGPPDVLALKEIEKPVPKDDEVLVKVRAASINAADWHLLSADVFLIRLMAGGLSKPKATRLGSDLAGQVEAAGKDVTQFKQGDDVFGWGHGAFADYMCAQEKTLARKPANLTFEQAAAVPVAGLTALQGLRDKGQVQPGQKVVIYGAGGGVGTFAVQIAKSCRAEVTAVCGSKNLDLASSVGADHVIDYTQEDFTRNGQKYDLILAVNGYHPIWEYRRALSPRGAYVMVGSSGNHILQAMLQAMLLGPLMSRMGTQKMGSMGITRINQADLIFMKELLEAGKIVPVIDRCYPLVETAAAFRYFGAGHTRGKVVITM
ncbi:MAG: NAD(P)-dependent alcohol dehydrogenase [Chloroflexi bacterium]|nr:NAD(P)-dependent alcohol dehydrogenase [Chloroflexota bacterium]